MRDQIVHGCNGTSDSDYCYFSIPGGTNLTKPRSLSTWNETTPIFVAGRGSPYIFDQIDVVGEGAIINRLSYNFIGMSHKEFVRANTGSSIPGNGTIFSPDNVLAYECGLWHCLQARAVEVSNGVVSDTLADFRNGKDPSKQAVANVGGFVEFVEDPSFNVDNISAYNIYPGFSNTAMSETLGGALTGAVVINRQNVISYSPIVESTYGPVNMGSTPDCLHAAWLYADDFHLWWERLAKSMTNNIRMNGYVQKEDHDRYAGVAWTVVVYTEVRWLWLTFPATLVLLSIIFLAATMVASRQSGLRPWKSFILPVLYTRLEESLQEEGKQDFAQGSNLLTEDKGRWTTLDNSVDTWIFRHVMKESKKSRGIRFAGNTSVDG